MVANAQSNVSTQEMRRLRKVFADHGITHQQVAWAMDVARVTVTLWLQGRIQSRRLDRDIPAFAAIVRTEVRTEKVCEVFHEYSL